MTMDEIAERNERLIAEHGHSIIHIFADLERGLPSFSYSIGLQDQGWPELVLSGIAPGSAQTILNRAAAEIKARNNPPSEGEIWFDLLAGEFGVRFSALSEDQIAANLLLACRRAEALGREPPAAFQLVYQDPERRWPEDPAYSCRMALLLAQSREETAQ